jgi:hypothetical protein
MPASGGPEELRKKLTATLVRGNLIVSLDNILWPLNSDALAMILTQTNYSDRILGHTENVELPTNVLFLATGNNLTFAGDLTSRALLCRIDPGIERPEERMFKISDLRQHVEEYRRELVHAALTVLRAYWVAGRLAQQIPPFGRFEVWSHLIRSALVWLDLADPCQTRERITLNDPDRGSAETLLRCWHTVFRNGAVTVNQIAQTVTVDGLGENEQALHEALLAVAGAHSNPNRLDTRRLARWCSQNLDRIVGGLRLTRTETRKNNATMWKVEEEINYHNSTNQFQADSRTRSHLGIRAPQVNHSFDYFDGARAEPTPEEEQAIMTLRHRLHESSRRIAENHPRNMG